MSANCVGILFSKDRAMQLDAALRSFYLHCENCGLPCLTVIYKVSNELHDRHYQQLATEYPKVLFLREHDFKAQVVAGLAGYEYVLFLVDDNIFTRRFSINEIMDSLAANDDALGFSLRLGTNTDFCYPLQKRQSIPAYAIVPPNFLKFNWVTGSGDFGYPLEVSSSVYRVADIYELLQKNYYINPNTLEMILAGKRGAFFASKPYLLCNYDSIAFCNPVNRVQDTCKNVAGLTFHYTAEQLARLFAGGHRIDVAKYSGFLSNGCHQETALPFTGPVVGDAF